MCDCIGFSTDHLDHSVESERLRERHRAESALSAELIPGEALRPGQEASFNPILTSNDQRQRKKIL